MTTVKKTQPTDTFNLDKALVDLAGKTAQQMDELVLTGDVLVANGVVWRENMEFPPLAGGYQIIFAGIRAEEKRGKLIIVANPQSEWAGMKWAEGQRNYIAPYGLTEAQQKMWLSSKYKGRYDRPALALLAAVLADPVLADKYMKYDPAMTRDEALRWDAHESIHHRLSHSSRMALAAMVKEMITSVPKPKSADPVKKQKPPKYKPNPNAGKSKRSDWRTGLTEARELLSNEAPPTESATDEPNGNVAEPQS